ncbi:MAG: alkaline phosphatase family protein [Candidatus Bathyarchaeota archaeon]|nr:MAG: alkaline phosphatase family protein [Candidatus Bathyarchaeota archaeon]
MSVLKVFFLALDALEYDFICSRNFPNLKQRQFVKVHIPRGCMTMWPDGVVEPFTPVIWKIILTGKNDQSEPAPPPVWPPPWKNRFLNLLRDIRIVQEIYAYCIRHSLIRRGFPEKIGFKRQEELDLKDSFIGYAETPILIHNPLDVSVKWELEPFHGEFDPVKVVRVYRADFEREREETLRRIDEEWDLFLIYSKFLDVVGHLLWQRDDVIEQYYTMVDQFAGEIRSRIGDAFMMIVSDHGMMPLTGTRHQGGDHSHHAFASFNREININSPLKITDIHDIVREKLQERA